MAKPMVRQSAPILLCALLFFCINATITVHLSSSSSGYSSVILYWGLCQNVSEIPIRKSPYYRKQMYVHIAQASIKSYIPKKFLQPPAVTPLTHSPSNTLISHFFLPALRSSSVSESGFKLQISRRVKYFLKSWNDIQNSPSTSNVRPSSSFSCSGMNRHSGDLELRICHVELIESRWKWI